MMALGRRLRGLVVYRQLHIRHDRRTRRPQRQRETIVLPLIAYYEHSYKNTSSKFLPLNYVIQINSNLNINRKEFINLSTIL